MIPITDSISIDEKDISERFVRAGGPGGQNVNKVSTAVQLRFDAKESGLPESVMTRLKTLAGRRMTADGVLIIEAKRFRLQERNREDALARLVDLIQQAAVPPKHRRPTRPSKGAKQRRLDGKRRQSDTKKGRGRVSRDD